MESEERVRLPWAIVNKDKLRGVLYIEMVKDVQRITKVEATLSNTLKLHLHAHTNQTKN